MNEKSRLILRIAAGLYLAYLGIKMVQGLISERPENMTLMFAVAVVFIIAGVLFVFFSVKNVMALRNEESRQEHEEIGSAGDEVESENNALLNAEPNKDETDEEEKVESKDCSLGEEKGAEVAEVADEAER